MHCLRGGGGAAYILYLLYGLASKLGGGLEPTHPPAPPLLVRRIWVGHWRLQNCFVGDNIKEEMAI